MTNAPKYWCCLAGLQPQAVCRTRPCDFSCGEDCLNCATYGAVRTAPTAAVMAGAKNTVGMWQTIGSTCV